MTDNISKIVSKTIELAGGNFIVEQLAKDLQNEIPGVRGFSARNKRNTKRFYDFYTQIGIGVEAKGLNLATMVAKLQSNENHLISNSATAVAELEAEGNYNGGHRNPETINEYVPEKFHPYVGKEF